MQKRYICLLILLILSACKSDKVNLTENKVEGYWEITEAKRNGKVTNLLKGGYFYFTTTGRMTTNIKGDTLSANYTLDGSKIVVGGDDPMLFKVNYLTADTLNLTSKIGSSNFEFNSTRPREK